MTDPRSLLDAAHRIRNTCPLNPTCPDCERLAAICEAGHKMVGQAENLHAIIKGECPSLLAGCDGEYYDRDKEAYDRACRGEER